MLVEDDHAPTGWYIHLGLQNRVVVQIQIGVKQLMNEFPISTGLEEKTVKEFRKTDGSDTNKIVISRPEGLTHGNRRVALSRSQFPETHSRPRKAN